MEQLESLLVSGMDLHLIFQVVQVCSLTFIRTSPKPPMLLLEVAALIMRLFATLQFPDS